MRALVLIAALVVAACGAAAESTEPDATPTVDPTTAPTTAPTPTRAPTATPEPTPEPTIDPEAAFALYKSDFWTTFEDTYRGELATALEDDYAFVESIDEIAYDDVDFAVTYTFTNDWEGIYARDHDEWHADTWELYRDFARDFWVPIRTQFDSGLDLTIDWTKWTPRLVMSGNKNRLRVSCPGSIIAAIGDREADQADFEDACAFKYGRE